MDAPNGTTKHTPKPAAPAHTPAEAKPVWLAVRLDGGQIGSFDNSEKEPTFEDGVHRWVRYLPAEVNADLLAALDRIIGQTMDYGVYGAEEMRERMVEINRLAVAAISKARGGAS